MSCLGLSEYVTYICDLYRSLISGYLIYIAGLEQTKELKLGLFIHKKI